jgi:hypothetical protein
MKKTCRAAAVILVAASLLLAPFQPPALAADDSSMVVKISRDASMSAANTYEFTFDSTLTSSQASLIASDTGGFATVGLSGSQLYFTVTTTSPVTYTTCIVDGYSLTGGANTWSGYENYTYNMVISGLLSDNAGKAVVFSIPAYPPNRPEVQVNSTQLGSLQWDGAAGRYTGAVSVFRPSMSLRVTQDGEPVLTGEVTQNGSPTSKAVFNPGDISYPVCAVGFNEPGTFIVDIGLLSLTVTYGTPELRINGNPVSVSAAGEAADYPYMASAAVSGGSLTVYTNDSGSGITADGSAPDVTIEQSGENTWTVVLPDTGTYTFYSGAISITITYQIIPYVPPPQPVPDITVQAEADGSRDSILVPSSTIETGATSTTAVSPIEVDALIASAAAQGGAAAGGEAVAVVSIQDRGRNISSYTVTFQGSDASRLAACGIDVLAVRCGAGETRLRRDELTALSDGSGNTLSFGMNLFTNNGLPGVDVSLLQGQDRITAMASDTYECEIRIPYIPAEGQDINCLGALYIPPSGQAVPVVESVYHEDTGYLSLFTNHLSKYSIAYNPVVFPDVRPNHWASGYILYLASRGIINGLTDGKFGPDDKVSRAQYVAMLTRAFSSAKLGTKAIKCYSDVDPDAWYAKSVAWSYINNISTILAQDGSFYPDRPLTRQDMAVLSNNMTLGLSLRLPQKGTALTFSDQSSISQYALSAVDRMTKYGIIAGAGGKYFPNSGLTRAEAAKIISTLMKSMR